jgi:cyanuric acid amidohydrolase
LERTQENIVITASVMAHINILKFGVSSPADTTPLKQLKAAGYGSKDILAVIGKSEGQHLVQSLATR